MCVYQLYTHTHKVKLAKCAVLRVISDYPITLTYCTAWENPRDLVAWFLWLWDDPSHWRAAELQDPPSPFSDHLHPFMCPPFVSPFPFPPPFFVLFSLLLFSHSLSGRATRGGPSQPNPEPKGTRGSIGCNSESINSSKANVCLKRWQTVQPNSFLMLLRAWDVCSQDVCPCCSLRRWQRSLPPLRNRFRYHLYCWPTKFLFRCVSTVLPLGAKCLLFLLQPHHLTWRQLLSQSCTFVSVFCDMWGVSFQHGGRGASFIDVSVLESPSLKDAWLWLAFHREGLCTHSFPFRTPEPCVLSCLTEPSPLMCSCVSPACCTPVIATKSIFLDLPLVWY